jgi:succinoglycan biosynthesis transport protein ExoP
MKNPNDEFTQTSLRDIFFVLSKHKSKIIIFFLSVMAFVSIGSFLEMSTYQSSAKLLIRPGRETTILYPEAESGQYQHFIQSFENQVNSEAEFLNSWELVQKVVDSIGIDAFQRDMEGYSGQSPSSLERLRHSLRDILQLPKKILDDILTYMGVAPPDDTAAENQVRDTISQQFLDNLDVQVIKGSNIIVVSYEAQNPRFAHDVLERLIEFYLDKHLAVYATAGSYQFFKKESDKLLLELKMSEKKLEEFKIDKGLGSLLGHQEILTQQIADLKKKIEEKRSSIDTFRTLMNSPYPAAGNKDVYPAFDTAEFNTPAITQMLSNIHSLRLKEQELLSTFKETSVPVVEIRRQIKETETLLQNLQNGLLDTLLSQKGALQQQLENAEMELDKINQAETRYDQLEREKVSLEENYKKYSNSMEQTRIDQALEKDKISNIKVAEAPSIPFTPTRPEPILVLVLGFLTGIFGGVGLAFLAEYWDRTFQKPEQIEEKLGLPVLASIGTIKSGQHV